MAQNNRVNVIVAAQTEGQGELQRLADEVERLGDEGAISAEKSAQLARSLRDLAGQRQLVDGFRTLKNEVGNTERALEEAQITAQRLGKALSETDAPTRAMKNEFEAARRAVLQLKADLLAKQQALEADRIALAQAGLATRDLAQHSIDLARATASTVDEARQLSPALRATAEDAAKAARNIQTIGKRIDSLDELRRQFEQARQEVTQLAGEMSRTATPSATLKREFMTAAQAAVQLEQRLIAGQRQLAGLRVQLDASGASTRRLDAVQLALVRSLDGSTQKAQAFGGALAQVGRRADETAARVDNAAGGMELVAGRMRAAAATVAAAFTTDRIFDAMLRMEGLEKALVTVTGSTKAAGKELEYIKGVANRLGIPVEIAAQSWIRFSAAAKGTALEGQKARAVFESVSSAMARMGRSGDDISGALLALEQMLSKGVVSSEELKQQLGERLPGAFKLAASAVGVTETELNKLLETGAITADELLPRLANELNKTFGDPEKKVIGLGASWQRLKDSLFGAAGDNGNGLLGGTLIKLFDDLTSKTKQTNVHLAEMDKHLDQAGASFQSGKIIDGIKGIGSAAADATKSLFEWSPTGLLIDKWNQLTGKTKEAVEAAKAVVPAAQAATVAQNAQGQSLARLALDLATAKTAFEAEAKSVERSSKARIDQAKAAVEVAQANQDEVAALKAKQALAEAESASSVASLAVKKDELTLADRELSVLNAQLASRTRVTEADKQKVAAQRDKIEAIKAEIAALDAATRAAEANAEAAKRAASDTEAAFKVLGLQSQQELEKSTEKAKAAYEAIRDAAASGAVKQKYVQEAFLAYAKQALQTGDAVSNAGLQTQAAINGVEQEYAKLAETANKSSGVAAAGLDSIGDAGRRAGQELAEGADQAAESTGKMVDSAASGAGSVAAWMGQFVDGLYSNLGKMSTAAMNEFAQLQGAVNRIDTSQSQTQLERLQEGMKKSLEEMGRFKQVMMSGSQDGLGINIGLSKIAISAKAVEVRFYEQAIAAEKLRQSLEGMDVTAQSTELSADNLAKQFNLLDKSQLTGLIEQVDRVNGKIRQTRDEAARATEALNGMAESAQESIDRANGNQQAIERRKLQEEMAKIDDLVKQGGDAGAAAQARARIKRAYDIRTTEIEAEQKASKDRQAAGGNGAGGTPSANPQPDLNRPSAPGQGRPAQPRQPQPSRVVQIDLSVNGPRQSVNVASDADAETLVRTLEDLKRRMR